MGSKRFAYSRSGFSVADIVFADEVEFPAVLRSASCAFGVFDGVHKGHRFVIERAIEHAREAGAQCTALTFDIDPDELFLGARLAKLMGNGERLEALASCGVDHVAVLHFDRAFANLEPLEFLARTFEENLPESIHVGEDFRFGCRAAGNVALLKRWADEHDVVMDSVELLAVGGEPVTSTRIRKLMAEGRFEKAQELL